MFKTMGFSQAKSGMSLADFKAYYETVHAPLAISVFPTIRRYVRNYVKAESGRMPAGAQASDFAWACITEMWFDDARGYEAFNLRLRDLEVKALFDRDEEVFVRPNSVWKFEVDEVEIPITATNK